MSGANASAIARSHPLMSVKAAKPDLSENQAKEEAKRAEAEAKASASAKAKASTKTKATAAASKPAVGQ